MNKKQLIATLLFVSLFTTSAYAVNIFDRALFKKVLLTATRRYALVNRVTGQVQYVMDSHKKWIVVPKALKTQYQSMYEAQTGQR